MQTSVFEVTQAAVLTQAAIPSAHLHSAANFNHTPIHGVIATIAPHTTEAVTATSEAACYRAAWGRHST